MSAEWNRIREVFHAALDLPAAERRDFVHQACNGDPELLEGVLSLLAEHTDSSVYDATALPRASGPSVFREGDFVAGRFRILRFIARGGMGEVYEAEDCSLVGQHIALKTLRGEFSSAEDAVARFRREIVIARDVSHENLCRVHDLVEAELPDPSGTGATRTIPCLTMELVRGESLSEYLRRHRPLTPDQCLPIAEQIAAGLACLHDRGIIHRDLKPSNIMLAPRRRGGFRIVVMDFGLAQIKDVESELYESRVYFNAGAPYFMAPERFGDGQPGMASDIYAFGMVLDEMVTRTRAFLAGSLQGLMYAKLHELPIPPAQRSQNLPPHWDRVIRRCLDPSPAARFASARDVISALVTPDEPEARKVREGIIRRAGTVALRATVPVRSRRFVILSAAVPAVVGVGALISTKPTDATVEVFDLENAASSDWNYLCRGVTAELARRLSDQPATQVFRTYVTRNRQSAAARRRTDGFSVDGTLQANAGQLRLTATIVDNGTGSIVWSEALDRVVTANSLELESDIAGRIADAVRANVLRLRNRDWLSAARRLLHPDSAALGAHIAPTASPVALDRLMRARYLLEAPSPSSIRAAIVALRKAVQDDPKFALAWSALADAHIQMANYVPGQAEALLQEGKRHATHAISLDPQLAEAHNSLAAVRQALFDWDGARQSYQQALRLKNFFPRARRWYAGMLVQFGEFDEALKQARLALAQDPYDALAPMTVGLFLMCARKYKEAIELMEPGVVGKDMEGLRHNLGQAYALMAQTETAPAKKAEWMARAIAQADSVASIEKRNQDTRPLISDRMYALFYVMAGEAAKAEPYIVRLTEDMNNGMFSPTDLAWYYAIQKNYGAALDLLERAHRNKDRGLMYVKVIPFLDNLHGHPRFEAIVRDLKL